MPKKNPPKDNSSKKDKKHEERKAADQKSKTAKTPKKKLPPLKEVELISYVTNKSTSPPVREIVVSKVKKATSNAATSMPNAATMPTVVTMSKVATIPRSKGIKINYSDKMKKEIRQEKHDEMKQVQMTLEGEVETWKMHKRIFNHLVAYEQLKEQKEKDGDKKPAAKKK